MVVFKFVAGDQVYDVAFMALSVTLVPAHILPDVVAIVGLGMAFTVKVATLVHVPLAPMTVPVTTGAPLDVPITSGPFNVFVVTPTIGPHVYDAAPLAVNETVFGEPLKLFIHKVGLLGVTVIDGKPKTVTVMVAKLVQVAADPKIEYVVLVVGLAIVIAVLVDVKAMFGDHVYVLAPLAVKVIELFKQITGLFGTTVTVGFTTTLAVAFCD